MIGDRLARYQDAGLLFFRLGFGLGFLFFHGWGKLSGGPETWAGVGSAMEMFGITFGHTFFGFMAAVSESIGGVLIALGLFYRPVCALLAFTMFVATVRHFVTGQGTPAHALKNFFVLVGLMPLGPGRYSLDAWLSSRRASLRERAAAGPETVGS
ncbi:DoxX family protein [Rhodocaloribacter litoris]|uniref:DoxX family protein n=1 Tax=Rhodocaloribacter litoris TaxID=2558931 RepID=UPI001421CDAF|nr:DoxX family protein [Rhodocaloribacter litoris]QXD15816.1 DoxX family protein [Rhodocaloribacter litoris]